MSDRPTPQQPPRPTPPPPTPNPNDQPKETVNGNGSVEEQVYSPYLSSTYLSAGFAGMKSTSMEDNVESWPCGTNPVEFGTIVTKGTSPNGTGAMVVQSGGAGSVAGAAVHDHIVATYGHYLVGMAVSVMTRGRLWMAVDAAPGTITEGAAVNFNPANGKVTQGTGTAVPHAAFRGVPATAYDIATGGTVSIAEIELHYPFAA